MYKELTAVSDNTRVSSPYRIQQQIESEYRNRRPPVNVRETVLRLRKEEEER